MLQWYGGKKKKKIKKKKKKKKIKKKKKKSKKKKNKKIIKKHGVRIFEYSLVSLGVYSGTSLHCWPRASKI